MNKLRSKFHEYFGESFYDFVVYRQGFAFLAILLVLATAVIQIIKLT
jgi:hypothetical protein